MSVRKWVYVCVYRVEMIFPRPKRSNFPTNALLCGLVLLLAAVNLPGLVDGGAATKKTSAAAPAATAAAVPVVHEAVIEEVTQKQLERILAEKEYVAVYWCKCNAVKSYRNVRVCVLCVSVC